jgi:hypothetical protein
MLLAERPQRRKGINMMHGITAFNAGEVTSYLEARVDFSKYNNACKTLENMLVTPQGPVRRRPGLQYIAEVKDSTSRTILIPFEFSKTDAYIIEAGHLYMRFYRSKGRILDDSENIYEITTPFTAEDLPYLRYVQSADVMYIVCPNHPPQKLSRTGHTSWILEQINYSNGPFEDENDTAVTITPSAPTGSITLTASDGIFKERYVGALWKISYKKDKSNLNGTLAANGSSNTIAVSGEYKLNVQGTWSGTVKFERSYDNGETWSSVYTRYNVSSSINEDYSDSEDEDNAIYRVTMEGWVSGKATYNLDVYDSIQHGYVRITGYISPTVVSAVVLSALGGTSPTKKWAKGYWSYEDGWPQTICFHEERLFFAASKTYPQTIWATKSSDYENMLSGSNADSALIYMLPGQNQIQWLLSQNVILMGTLAGTGKLSASSIDDPITPTNVQYRTQTTSGSADIPAILADDAALYIERGGKKVREFAYSYEKDRYVSPDMTILSSHITEDGITQFAAQKRPNFNVYCVLNSGNIAVMTYAREQDVIGWSRIVTEGQFEHVAVIPGTDEDEVWVIVKRTINGQIRRYIEVFSPQDWGQQQSDCFFVDSGLTYNSGQAVNITNISKSNPVVVTVDSWNDNIIDGVQVQISDVEGMTQLSGVYTVSNANAANLTFKLKDKTDTTYITSENFDDYLSGGTVRVVENTFANLDHLEGREVTVLADGCRISTATVSNGKITLPYYASVVHAGLNYTSTVQTMPLDYQLQEGSIRPKIKKITGIGFNFFETLGAQYGSRSDSLEEIPFRKTDTQPNQKTELFTGIKNCRFLQGNSYEGCACVVQSKPLPMTIRAIYIEYETY